MKGGKRGGGRERKKSTYAYPIPIRPQHADLLLIDNGVEVLELLLSRDVVVPLLSDGGVLALLDFFFGQRLGHFWRRVVGKGKPWSKLTRPRV